MTPDDPRHGTYAGYLTHRRDEEAICDDCRAARRAYMKQWRSDPEHKATEARSRNARSRALWRLASLHPDDYQRLYLEEIGPPLMADAEEIR